MRNPTIPTKEEALEILSPIHPEVHRSLDHGAFRSRAFFEAENAKPERSLQSMLVRYHAKNQLQKKFPDVVFDNLSLCGISLLCRGLKWRGRPTDCRVRLWKSLDNQLPNPGPSNQKKIYYTQEQYELPFPAGATRENGDVEELKFAILWNLSSKGMLLPLWLVCPKKFDLETGEIEVWWDVEVPDPTLATKPGPRPSRRKDLPIPLKEKEEQEEN